LEDRHQRHFIKKLSGSLKCDDCETYFLSGHEGYLKAHINAVHKKLNIFRCEYCNSSFSQKLHLDDHKKRSHFNKKPSQNFLCSECEASFENKEHLGDHMNYNHLKIKTYKCKKCHLSFSQTVQLKQHVNNDHLYPCRKCKVYFSKWDQLETHVNDYHMELKTQRCSECKNFPLKMFGSSVHDENCLLRF
jgi:KRAB domain-containing zinc finger protein